MPREENMRRKSKFLLYLAVSAAAVIPVSITLALPGTSADLNTAVVPALAQSAAAPPNDQLHMLNQYCTACHNDKVKTAGMSVQQLAAADLTQGTHDDVWEKILWRLSGGEMPPKGRPRPPQAQIDDFTGWLEASLDKFAYAHPNPGRATVRRMNRAEYANAVRDI